jgi:hypothetical protein
MAGYDVAILSDLRDPGGDPASVAAEVRAQAAGGLSTVLLHVPSPGPPDARPFDPRIVACLRDGLADLAHDGDPVDARLLLIRGPRVLTAARLPVVRAGRTVLVADEAAGDVRERAERCFGPDVTWAPTGPEVREQLRRATPGLPLARADWHATADAGDQPAREPGAWRTGAAAHLSRLGLRPSRPVPPPRPAPAPARRPTRVLLLGDHLDRLLAIAGRLPGDLEPVLVTGSPELPPDGPLAEYLPGRAALEMTAARWSGYLRDRLRHLIDVHRARAVVLDGPAHDGVLAATADHPGVAWLWIRAAMWRRGTGTGWQGRSAAFDAVLEPGEFAAAGDEGWTVADPAPVTRVAPITRLDRGDLLDRAAARASLGLADEPALLRRGVPVTVPGFRVIEPAGRAVRAADLAVATADYTSFHELLAAGVPTVFVPDRAAGTDDQLARARFAAAAGAALCAEPGADLGDVLTAAARPAVREALARRCAELAFGNGAAAAAAWIGAHCGVSARIGG